MGVYSFPCIGVATISVLKLEHDRQQMLKRVVHPHIPGVSFLILHIILVGVLHPHVSLSFLLQDEEICNIYIIDAEGPLQSVLHTAHQQHTRCWYVFRLSCCRF